MFGTPSFNRGGALSKGGGFNGLDLDFVLGRYALNGPYSAAFPTGWSFSRTGAGTALDAAGNVVSFATGVPRITDRGLLVEESRTNLLLNSETLSTQSVTVTAAEHTLSFFGTGTVTLSGASTAGPLVGTGANNRVTLTFTPSAGSLTLTVSGSVTFAQLELGSFPTSPIITTGSAATRGMDNAFLSGFTLNGAAVTLVAEAEFPSQTPTNDTALATLTDAESAGQSLVGAWRAPNGNAFFQARTAGVGTAVNYGSLSRPGARILRMATALDGTVATAASDGALAIAGTVGLPPGLTRLNIGVAFSSTRPANAYIRRVRVLPYAASDAELQALTS